LFKLASKLYKNRTNVGGKNNLLDYTVLRIKLLNAFNCIKGLNGFLDVILNVI